MSYAVPDFQELAARLSPYAGADLVASDLERLADSSKDTVYACNNLWSDSSAIPQSMEHIRSIIYLHKQRQELLAATEPAFKGKLPTRKALTALAYLAENPDKGYSILVNGILVPNPELFGICPELYP